MSIGTKYLMGSRLYGSHTEESDYDWLYIVKQLPEENNNDVNTKYMTSEQFKQALNEHHIDVLECALLHKLYLGDFNINLGKLRKSISTITSNSWVKGKKKLLVEEDYDKYIAIKSIFHSLRILDFGIQIALHGTIIKKDSMNWVLGELRGLSNLYEGEELWNIIDTRYRKLYNSKKSEFKQLIPKEKIAHVETRNLVRSVLIEHNIEATKKLLDDIIEVTK